MTDMEFIRGAFGEIKEHLSCINGRCLEHTKKIAILETKQKEIATRLHETRMFTAKVLGGIIAAVILAILGVIFGKKF